MTERAADRTRLSVLGRAALEQAGFTDATIKRAYKALDRALDAKKVKDFSYKGDVISGPEREDHDVQVRAAELVTKLADHHPSKLEIDLDGQMRTTSDQELISILLSLGPMPGLGDGAEAHEVSELLASFNAPQQTETDTTADGDDER
jgi:hypothetical protein